MPDPSVFDTIETQMGEGDKRSLLSVQEAIRRRPYTYLEIGSHLGGSLQPFVVDSRCRAIVSIDPRPTVQPDERWVDGYEYPDNSTQRMLDRLDSVPGGDLTKIRTIEASTADISPAGITADLCFIDGEHTNRAALRDAEFCQACSPVILFHDRTIVARAIDEFLRRTRGIGYPLPDLMFVVELEGDFVLRSVRGQVPHARAWALLNRLGLSGYALRLEASLQRIRQRTWLRRLFLRS
jgi:hypothetical protein